MTKKQKKTVFRVSAAAVATVLLLLLRPVGLLGIFLWTSVYLFIGYDILFKAGFGIIHGQLLDENFLMSAATLGAMTLAVLGKGEFTEAVTVMLFYQTGELFQSLAVSKSRRSIGELMNIRPDFARVEGSDGELSELPPEDVAVGSIIAVSPGERIAIDGVVVEGSSGIDTSALTGESVPRTVGEGDEVCGGCINLDGVLRIRTVKPFGESTVSKILELVENASSRKSRSEKFISKFAKIYTPIVCLSALAIALLPPLVLLVFGNAPLWGDWVYRALTFLVISCPCALVVGIPLTFFAGLGGASRSGILIKGSNYMETLSKVKRVAFDKTGTLTRGSFEVFEISPARVSGLSAEELLEYAAAAESASSHPIARSIISAYGKTVDRERLSDIREVWGKGVVATFDGKRIYAGNRKLMKDAGVAFEVPGFAATAVYVAVDGTYCGHILISDLPKEGAKEAVLDLRSSGVEDIVMLTGDVKEAAEAVGRELCVDRVFSQLLPDGKVEKLEELLSDGQVTAFVGDGINDAPVLSRADIGIAMGGIGSDAAIEAADVVIMDDDVGKTVAAVKTARRCMRIVYENILLTMAVKAVCLVLGALGLAGMWAAVFADVGVMVLAVLNAVRAMKRIK